MVFENPASIIGLILWFVGFIFILNGINMTGRMSPKECGVWNLVISSFMMIPLKLNICYI